MDRVKMLNRVGRDNHTRNFDVSPEAVLHPGHLACPGCGGALSINLALKALGKKVILVGPACCWSVCDGPFPYSASGVPFLHCAFETAAITAAGVRAGLEVQGKNDILVVAWAGDGGTFDIGLQALSGAAERNDDILYVCYDNEAYMNTGVQRSSATPTMAWTTTTPSTELTKKERKKNIMEILAAHRIPYAATATAAYPDDLIGKMTKAKSIRGFRFIHVLSPCPVGWGCEERMGVTLSRLAVQARIFPLYEIEGGVSWRSTVSADPVPVEEYLKAQGRFRQLAPEAMRKIQKDVDTDWNRLCMKFLNHWDMNSKGTS